MTKDPVPGVMIGGIINLDENGKHKESGADILCRNDAMGVVMYPEMCEALLVGGDEDEGVFSGLPDSWKSMEIYVHGYPKPIAPSWTALLSASIPQDVQEISMADGKGVGLQANEALAWTGLKRDLLGTKDVSSTGSVRCNEWKEGEGNGGVGQFKPDGDGWMPFKDKPSILWSAGVRPCNDADVRLYCLCPFDAN